MHVPRRPAAGAAILLAGLLATPSMMSSPAYADGTTDNIVPSYTLTTDGGGVTTGVPIPANLPSLQSVGGTTTATPTGAALSSVDLSTTTAAPLTASSEAGAAVASSLNTIMYSGNTCDYFPLNTGSTVNYGSGGLRSSSGKIYNSTTSGAPTGASEVIESRTSTGGSGGSITAGQDTGTNIAGVAVRIDSSLFRSVTVTMPWFARGNLRAGSNTTLGSGFIPVLGGIVGSFAGRSSSTASYNFQHDFYEDSRGSVIPLASGKISGVNGVGGTAMNVQASGRLQARYPLRSGSIYVAAIQLDTSGTYQTNLGANVQAESNFAANDIIGQVNTAVNRWTYGLSPGYILTHC